VNLEYVEPILRSCVSPFDDLNDVLALSLVEHADMAISYGDPHLFGEPRVGFSSIHVPRLPERIECGVRPLFPRAKLFVRKATEWDRI
jgi:hypothetical protein